jgi:hypothetical protein
MVDRSPSAETRDSLLGNIFGRIFFIKNFLNCGESFLSNCRWESENHRLQVLPRLEVHELNHRSAQLPDQDNVLNKAIPKANYSESLRH